MAKFVFVAVLLMVVVAACAATGDGKPHESKPQPMEGSLDHHRFRRSTCDGILGSAACSTSCIASGKTGGSCIAGFCVCNTDNLKDVLD